MSSKIDLTEKFPHLPGAPIVEALVDLRCKAEVPWEEQSVKAALTPAMGGYDYLDSQKESQIQVKVSQGQEPEQSIRDLGWRGLRYRSSDQKNIAQFNRDGFIFRRLPPYEDWDKFRGEALRLWQIHRSIANTTQIQRIGLRYVNRIKLAPDNMKVSEYISGGPLPPKGLGGTFHNFIHRDTWACDPYAVNVARAFQALPQQPMALILDIDVFSTTAFEFQPSVLDSKLAEMRWLKNKTFFGIISNKLLSELQKQP
jgi:uncharacterized protein (TIGR04255 family)